MKTSPIITNAGVVPIPAAADHSSPRATRADRRANMAANMATGTGSSSENIEQRSTTPVNLVQNV